MKGLAGRRVMVTGGASGIGAATARRFIEEGARVFVVDRDAAALARCEREHPSLAGSVEADVSKVSDVRSAFAKMDAVVQGVDVLINNAGIDHHAPFIDIKSEEWRHILSVNLDGVFYVAQEAARRMLRQGDGVILNMGSVNGIMGFKDNAHYNVAKAGVIELTRSLALELAPTVRVNVVCPGFIETAMVGEERRQLLVSKIPLGRLGRPEEIAGLFAYLASDEARFATGQTFVMDGGEIAGGLAS